jgi:cytochrome c oxidase assembly protein subunit 11
MNKNARLALACAGFFVLMVGAAYAAVPLYKRFCQLTGFDGATRRAAAASVKVLDRTVTVRFDTNVRNVPWEFSAEQGPQTVKLGATGLARFKVVNTSDQPITGRASYNVLPETAGPYFQKLECFCFKDQTIPPHATREFPVAYYVDPRLADDFDTKGLKEITLSYTFFPSVNPAKPASSQASAPGGAARAGL